MITMVDLNGYGGARDDGQVTPQRKVTVRDDDGDGQQKASKHGRAMLASMLNRTGHARFRRGPVVPEPAETDFARCDRVSASASASSSFPSSVTGVTGGGEGSVSNGRAALLTAAGVAYDHIPVPAGGKLIPPPTQPASDGHEPHDAAGHATHGGGRCHCSKERKSRVKRSIHVPAISSKNADIPPDDYSWRKYGQKPIKGSPYPRGYYKCSTVRGCPARKHVERDPREPSMLIVTYGGDHRHDVDPAAAVGVPERRAAP